MQRLEVWTDGCCNSNGSGWAVIVPSHKIIFRAELPGATNQKAELGAVIQAVYKFGPHLHIFTDSKYTIGCFTDWYPNWLKNGWKNSKKNPVENRPLIELGLRLGAQYCTYEHVNGHSGNYYNDMADHYAKNAELKSEHHDWTLISG
jgi:ribonuclease HI